MYVDENDGYFGAVGKEMTVFIDEKTGVPYVIGTKGGLYQVELSNVYDNLSGLAASEPVELTVELSGLGKFRLKRVFRKTRRAVTRVVKKVGNVIKKVAKKLKKVLPITAIAAGVWYATPWFTAAASKIGSVAATKILQEGINKNRNQTVEVEEGKPLPEPDWFKAAVETYITAQRAKAEKEAIKEQIKAQTAPVMVPGFAPPGAAYYGFAPPGAAYYGFAPPGAADYARLPVTEKEPITTATANMPNWIIPALIAGALTLISLRK